MGNQSCWSKYGSITLVDVLAKGMYAFRTDQGYHASK
jgi:hypothetical protein